MPRPPSPPSSAPLPRAPGAPARKGRGATFNPGNRYRAETREAVDDGWAAPEYEAPVRHEPPAQLKTTVTIQASRTIITRNRSPDVGFEQSINPYQGCEHGCIYCFARPTHAYLDLSPGLDFETRLFAKPNAAALLRAELAHPGYRCQPIALGTNTDPYQPIEREWRITRSILEVLAEHEHPVGVITKSALVERDIDLLAPMAAKGLAKVFLTVTTLDREIARTLEPRAAAPERRLAAMAALHAAGIPVGVMVAPVIPQLTDKDMEAILAAAHAAGAREAGYVMLRLPLEVAPLFRDWLQAHFPARAEHVMAIVRSMHGGRDYDSTWGQRMRGVGEFAQFFERRFAIARSRLGFNDAETGTETARFRVPQPATPPQGQLPLF